MRLYTIQPRFVYDTLCESGVFFSEPCKDPHEWICSDSPAIKLAYDWLCDEMVARGLHRPGANVYPVWAWHQYLGQQKPKPDLRDSNMRNYARNGCHILLTLDLPDDIVLLHDFEAWHHPLNYFHLASQRLSNRFERKCKAAGHPLYQVVPLQDKTLHAEMEQSWRTIFDLSACRRLLKRSCANQIVQATFWELHAAHVIGVVEFGGEQKRRTLPLPR